MIVGKLFFVELMDVFGLFFFLFFQFGIDAETGFRLIFLLKKRFFSSFYNR